MNPEMWVTLEDFHGPEACAKVDEVASDLIQSVRPNHESNYLDSERFAYDVLSALKSANLRIVRSL